MDERRTLLIELEPETAAGLDIAAMERGKATVDLVHEMIVRLIEDDEDYRMAADQVGKPGRRYTLEEVKARFALDD